MKDEAKIICPNCGTAIDVNNYVNSQIELITHEEKRRIEDKFNKESQANQRKLEIEIDKLKKEQERIDTEKQNISNTINKEVTLKLQSEKYDIEKAVKSQIEAEKSFEIQKLKEQIEEKNRQLKENIELKIQLEQIKFEKDTAEQRITLQKDKELAGKINEEKINIKKSIEDEYILKIREFEKKLDDQTKLAEEMKRKAEQGSMQMQGEVQELELENIIKDISPFDQIQEIKKGQRGADLIHNVYNEQMQFCGTIYYESKRTKEYDKNWVGKLKNDNLEVKADILVLVSEAMPQNKTRFFYENGVWICHFPDIKPLILVLRRTMIEINKLKITQQGSNTKMELLYNYLTSNEFHGQLESIILGFQDLQKSYLDEKLKMQKIWKEREKQFDRILSNAVNFYGSLKGIAGASIQDISMLESPDNLLSD